MRELGLDQAIKDAAHAIPDARDRLHYVARMTEQAANRVLNAAEHIQPLQETLQRDAQALDARWQAWFDHPVELDQVRELVDDTRALLKDIPQKAQDSTAKLLASIMTKDIQAINGQLLMRRRGVVADRE